MTIAAAIAVMVFAAACDDNGDEGDRATPTGVTSTATPVPEGTATPPVRETIQIFFLDEEKFAAGEEPFVTAVEREIEASPLFALEALFMGPTAEEAAQGLRFEASGATGFTNFTVDDDGIARVQLTAGCDSRGSTFTVAQEIIPTLTQFPSISYVKILDPEGNTGDPEGESNSIPACLEP
jgi:hypothetical protein